MDQTSGPAFAAVPATAHLLEPVIAWAASAPDRIVAAYPDGDGWADVTAAALWGRVRAVAKGLIASGIDPGDRVALMSATRFEWTVADDAVMAAGGVTVPIYETASAEQIAWILADSGARLVIVETPEMAAVVATVRLPHDGAEVVVLEAGGLDELTRRGNDVDDVDLERRIAALASDQLVTIVYTSGTTGRPKGCAMTHANLVANVAQNIDAVRDMLRDDEVLLMFLPLAHTLAKIVSLVATSWGALAVYGHGIGRLPEDLAAVQPTMIVAVPRIFEKAYDAAQHKARAEHKEAVFHHAVKVAIHWSEHAQHVGPGTRVEHVAYDHLVYAKIRRAFGGRLRFAFSGGGPLGERLTHFFNGVGVKVLEGYGLTETSPTLSINRADAWEPGTVGRPAAGTTIAVAGDGEILAKGPQVFNGYWHDDKATGQVLDADGWFHTGDIGTIDDRGFLRITGRKKELIVTAAGKNVAPAPLEDRLRSHAVVSQAVVIGEGRPFIAALITVDAEAATGLDAATVQHLVSDAVADANQTVSRAESIREFAILEHDLSIEAGELTPTLKVRRSIVATTYAGVIDGIYGTHTGV